MPPPPNKKLSTGQPHGDRQSDATGQAHGQVKIALPEPAGQLDLQHDAVSTVGGDTTQTSGTESARAKTSAAKCQPAAERQWADIEVNLSDVDSSDVGDDADANRDTDHDMATQDPNQELPPQGDATASTKKKSEPSKASKPGAGAASAAATAQQAMPPSPAAAKKLPVAKLKVPFKGRRDLTFHTPPGHGSSTDTTGQGSKPILKQNVVKKLKFTRRHTSPVPARPVRDSHPVPVPTRRPRNQRGRFEGKCVQRGKGGQGRPLHGNAHPDAPYLGKRQPSHLRPVEPPKRFLQPKKFKDMEFAPPAPVINYSLHERLEDLFPKGVPPGHLRLGPMNGAEYDRRLYCRDNHVARYDVAFHKSDGRLVEAEWIAPAANLYQQKGMQHVTSVNKCQRTALDWCLVLRAQKIFHGYHTFAGDLDPREGILMCGKVLLRRTGHPHGSPPKESWVHWSKDGEESTGLTVRGIPMVKHGFQEQYNSGKPCITGSFVSSKDRIAFSQDHPCSVLCSISHRRTVYIGNVAAANSELLEISGPLTNKISLAPTHNLHASATTVHNKDRASIDLRIDMNGVFDGKLPTALYIYFVLEPLLRWAFDGLKDEEFDFSGILPEELGLTDKDGHGRADGVFKVLFELEGLLVHCKEGKNRTALTAVAFLLALHYETNLSVEAAIAYVIQIRPCCDFADNDQYGSPVARRGEQLVAPTEPVEPTKVGTMLSKPACTICEFGNACSRGILRSRRNQRIWSTTCSPASGVVEQQFGQPAASRQKNSRRMSGRREQYRPACARHGGPLSILYVLHG